MKNSQPKPRQVYLDIHVASMRNKLFAVGEITENTFMVVSMET